MCVFLKLTKFPLFFVSLLKSNKNLIKGKLSGTIELVNCSFRGMQLIWALPMFTLFYCLLYKYMPFSPFKMANVLLTAPMSSFVYAGHTWDVQPLSRVELYVLLGGRAEGLRLCRQMINRGGAWASGRASWRKTWSHLFMRIVVSKHKWHRAYPTEGFEPVKSNSSLLNSSQN